YHIMWMQPTVVAQTSESLISNCRQLLSGYMTRLASLVLATIIILRYLRYRYFIVIGGRAARSKHIKGGGGEGVICPETPSAEPSE
ncbi:hypothetical protein, partial [Candidatus Pyrohabitans sp.]